MSTIAFYGTKKKDKAQDNPPTRPETRASLSLNSPKALRNQRHLARSQVSPGKRVARLKSAAPREAPPRLPGEANPADYDYSLHNYGLDDYNAAIHEEGNLEPPEPEDDDPDEEGEVLTNEEMYALMGYDPGHGPWNPMPRSGPSGTKGSRAASGFEGARQR